MEQMIGMRPSKTLPTQAIIQLHVYQLCLHFGREHVLAVLSSQDLSVIVPPQNQWDWIRLVLNNLQEWFGEEHLRTAIRSQMNYEFVNTTSQQEVG